MNFQKGYIVEVIAGDGVSRLRGEVTQADEHQFTVHGQGWSQTFQQDTNQVEVFSNG
jgi:hypothetical protein